MPDNGTHGTKHDTTHRPSPAAGLRGAIVRVVAAISGGVDSAVAAARAIEAGHEVVGVHLALASSRQQLAGGGCGADAARDAQRVADALGIELQIWDLSQRFQHEVVDNFVAEYAAGRTPNPCLRCNETIKFGALLEESRQRGFETVCTGHYAQLIAPAPGEAPQLHRAASIAKDQSYVLAVVPPTELAHAMFPVGGYDKSAIRAEADARGLPTASKPDSVDICFIPDGDVAGWLRDHFKPRPGLIVDTDGNQVGQHQGTHVFTIGQRRGLHLGEPTADGQRRYVVDIQPHTNTVVVGPLSALQVHEITGENPLWHIEIPPPGSRFEVQVRAHSHPVAGTMVARSEEKLTVRLDEPILGVATGQGMVLYDGPRVAAAATITQTR